MRLGKWEVEGIVIALHAAVPEESTIRIVDERAEHAGIDCTDQHHRIVSGACVDPGPRFT